MRKEFTIYLKQGIRFFYGGFKLLPAKLRQTIVHPFVKWSRNYGGYHLVSFPKCGRTWVRMLVGYCMVHHYGLPIKRYLEIDLLGFLRRDLPIVGVSHDGLPQFETPDGLTDSKAAYDNQKVIFLVRDPRDVIVSNYFQQTKRRETFDGTLDEFVQRRRGGIDTLLEFYAIWHRQKHVPRQFLLVRYEDLQENVHAELKRILGFLEMQNVHEKIRDEAIREASFERMKQREKKRDEDNFRLQPGDPSDPESYKVRRGEVGGYTDYLNEDTVEYVESRMKEKLPSFFGYEPNNNTNL